MGHEIGDVQCLLRPLETVIVFLVFERSSLFSSFPLNLLEVVLRGNHLDSFQSAFNRLRRDLDYGVLRALAADYRTKMHTKCDSCVIPTRQHHAVHELIDSESVAFDQVCRCPGDLAHRAQNLDI